ncbi:hypothetical protein M758_4G204400 [Ceratodon purpureus]|nr:hypothetical protein M758_4G204400 [Ceratodon purpureus]
MIIGIHKLRGNKLHWKWGPNLAPGRDPDPNSPPPSPQNPDQQVHQIYAHHKTPQQLSQASGQAREYQVTCSLINSEQGGPREREICSYHGQAIHTTANSLTSHSHSDAGTYTYT